MRLVWQLVVVAVVSVVGNATLQALRGDVLLTLVVGGATAALGLATYAWVVRRTEHRAPDEVAWRGAVPAVARGTLLGVALCGAVIATVALLGGYTVHGLGSVPGAVGVFGFMSAVAVMEELLFRGVLFRWIEHWAGTWVALASTAVIFGAAHLANPHAGLWGATAIAIEAGTMLAAAYVATRRLWVPIGLHLGWNFALGGVFSAEVSGNGTSSGLLDTALSGPAWITGGAFGPEASVFAVLFCGATAVVFLGWAHRRGRIVPMRRAARRAPAATLAR